MKNKIPIFVMLYMWVEFVKATCNPFDLLKFDQVANV